VLAADGAEMVETTLAAPRAEAQQAENLGRQVAAALLAQGAGAMIAAARGPGSP
jgi:porphobilinogen deaminase